MRRFFFAAALATLAFTCSLTELDGFANGGAQTDPGAPDAPVALEDAKAPVDVATPDGGAPDADAGPAPVVDAYGDAVRADHPAAWFRFEEAPGATIAKDEMGAHDATLNGAVLFSVDGAVGKAMRTGGGNGRGVILGDVFDFEGKAELALEVWAENDEQASEYDSLFSKRIDNDLGPQDGWIFYVEKSTRTANFQFWKGGFVSASAYVGAVDKGLRHYVITATKSGAGVDYAAYLDGVFLEGTLGATTEEPNTLAGLRIGATWTGRIDEAAIYEHPLSLERVRAHYRAVRP